MLPNLTESTTIPPNLATTYHHDYALWLEHMAQALRDRNPNALDWENLLEEIESLGRSEKKSVKSNLRIVLIHLLKWHYQSQNQSLSWLNSIAEHRQRLYDDFEASPSLRNYTQEVFAQAYSEARKHAARETGLPVSHFPDTCPWTLVQVLQEDWLPDH